MNLRFWGVRGSIPTPEPDRLRYGGNTTCLEIGYPDDDEPVLIDCGSGIRAPGIELMRRPVSRIHILLTHFHWDHIQGLPSFAPLFQSGVEIIFYANRPPDQVRRLLGVLMAEPFFPVPFAEIGSRVDFRQIDCEQPFHAGPVTVEAFHLNHPQGAVGFRAESDGQVLVHASDHEHGNPEIDGIKLGCGDVMRLRGHTVYERFQPLLSDGTIGHQQAAKSATPFGLNRKSFRQIIRCDHLCLDQQIAQTHSLFDDALPVTVN